MGWCRQGWELLRLDVTVGGCDMNGCHQAGGVTISWCPCGCHSLNCPHCRWEMDLTASSIKVALGMWVPPWMLLALSSLWLPLGPGGI